MVGLRDVVAYTWQGRAYAGVVVEVDAERDIIEVYLRPNGGLCRTRLSSLRACGLVVLRRASFVPTKPEVGHFGQK